jgi:hypothetical protein
LFVLIYREIVRNFLCKNLKNKKNIFHKKINSQNFPLIESLNYSQKIENCNQNESNLEINNNIISNDLNLNNNSINNSNFFEKKSKIEYNNIMNCNTNSNINDIVYSDLVGNNSTINKSKFNKNIFNIRQENNNINININSSLNNNNNKTNFYNIFNTGLKTKSNDNNDNSLLLNESDNNEIKVLKNNKVVYVNNYLLNSYSTAKKIKKFNKIAFVGRSKRSSKFRGVSRNGNQWQVLIMLKRGKSYVGSYNSEELAARIYDILALKYRGVKARTNFKYTSKQINKIREMDIDIKSKNLDDIITQIIA